MSKDRMHTLTNGASLSKGTNRAEECSYVLSEVQRLVISFIEDADRDTQAKLGENGQFSSSISPRGLHSRQSPQELNEILQIQIPQVGKAADGLLRAANKLMQHSVNTWSPGFMDKLYASTDAPGLAAELLLASLNTNVHVYAVSPALTLIEKSVSKELATLFSLNHEHSGGISVQGGSASNLTSLLIARNYRYPEIKSKGMTAINKPLTIFTSSEAHYSVSTAAVSLGFGTEAVWSVPVDQHGSMDVHQLELLVQKASAEGRTPFYVSATAGTTVLGAFDPLPAIGDVCRRYNLWFHVDAAWGGPAIFSRKHKHRLNGSHFADTIAINPHKMMGVPITCSFLLGKDLRQFYAANSLSAGYLFHKDPEGSATRTEIPIELPAVSDVYDLASLTPQCGRRGDSLKLYLSWIYHGTLGYEKQIDAAFAACEYMGDQVSQLEDLCLISEKPPPCCQCCFYYWPRKALDTSGTIIEMTTTLCTRLTRRIASGLAGKGWMIDYAPGEAGEFLRVVTNRSTTTKIVDALLKDVINVGEQSYKDMINNNEYNSRRVNKQV